jgi:hypothetical protein
LVPTPIPTPGCKPTDVFQSLVTLDQSAAKLKSLTRSYAVRGLKLKAVSKRTSDKYQRTANTLYLDGWTAVWGIPRTILECSGVSNCSTITLKPNIDAYTKAINGLHANNLSLAKSLKKGRDRKGAEKLAKDSQTVAVESKTGMAIIPPTTSSCVK